MKQSIKLSLIAITAISIVGLLFYFTKKIDNAEVERIVPQNFVKYIEQRVIKEVDNQPFNEAKSSFYALIGEINTESFVWLNDSTKALTEEESLKCKRIAFYAYAPIFTVNGIEYFERQSWTTRDADAYRDEAKALLAYNIAESGTQVKSDLEQIVKNVKEYHEALGVVSSASQCWSVDAVNRVISNAKKYEHAPLTNNRTLMTNLNNVPSVAKDGLANRIASRGDEIIARKCNYSTYTQWYEDYQLVIGSIDEYENTFGKVTQLTTERTKLEQADEEALDCYD